MGIKYSEYVKLKVGDKIKVRGYVRTIRFFRGYRVAYMTKTEQSSCHWTNIQEIVEKQDATQT